MKLTIELIPKGAWGNNLRELLTQKDWDKLRELCYVRAGNRCNICGREDNQLHAHEVWDFDYAHKTQTLKDIIALCPACHGVKHFRNSERIGYGEQAKKHFIQINKCSELEFAAYCMQVKATYDKLNEVLRWKINADLTPFGGGGMKLKENTIPFITDPYQDTQFPLCDNETGQGLCCVKTDNYMGEIAVIPDTAYKVQWETDNEILKSDYKYAYPFISIFSVKNILPCKLRFRLIGNEGEFVSKEFPLSNI